MLARWRLCFKRRGKPSKLIVFENYRYQYENPSQIIDCYIKSFLWPYDFQMKLVYLKINKTLEIWCFHMRTTDCRVFSGKPE